MGLIALGAPRETVKWLSNVQHVHFWTANNEGLFVTLRSDKS